MTTIATSPAGLPEQFAELDQFAAWILESQDDRYALRLASSMDEMTALYKAVMARIADIIEYCNQFDIDDMPEPARKLMLLTYSFIQASFPVEAWKQPRVPDSGAASIHIVREPGI